MKITLNKAFSKKNNNCNNVLATQLMGSKKLLPQSQIFKQLNEIEIYNSERENCNLIRLNCVINPICSNVIFNTISEVIKNEGNPNTVKLLNYGVTDGYINRSDFSEKIYCKNADVFLYGGALEAVRDTQISSNLCGFKYHCGLDIFNNHILRNNTFKTVCYNSVKNPEFNTLNDWMRDENGVNIKGVINNQQKLPITSDKLIPNGYIDSQHLYTTDDIDTFDNSIDNKLIEKNGWFGFTNIGKFSVVDNNNEPMDIFRVINYRRSCDFIQMYPSSDLWTFTPRYNSYLNRLEKNWNYCLTYPSSSTTQNITFIRNNTNSLKIMYINDFNIKLKNGLEAIKIYSISKHGLKKGEFINLYQNDDIAIGYCEVVEIEDEYIFYIVNSGLKLIKKWYELTKADTDTMGTDDFIVKTNVPLENLYIKYNKQTYSGTDITITSNSEITQSNISIDIGDGDYVSTSTKWKTKQFHGKTYNITFQNSNSRSINLDPLASGETRVHSSDIKYDLLLDTFNDSIYTYKITNPSVDMDMQYVISSDRTKVYCGHGDDRKTYYLIDNKYVNIDDNAQDFSFKKIVDGEEVEYYVRIFSKIPNWKGCDVKIDQHQLYGTNKNLIAKHQTLDYDFENHISTLAYAKNIYGDDISQIVYTDDIDISYLKDNLGRPLTSIYFTILKNNKGYKEWYGKNGKQIEIRKYNNVNDEDYHIEYSHCFGMLNCAFRLSKESLPSVEHNNSMQINNIDSSFQYQGLDVEDLQHSNLVYADILSNEDNFSDDKTKKRSYRSNFKEILNDEIQYGAYYDSTTGQKYLGDTHFYGDLCAYSKKRVFEESIQQIEMRFNTAQREVSILDKSYQYFKKLYYDEIVSDDKDDVGFKSELNEILHGNQHKEGYCYNPHHEIKIKTLSKTISSIKSVIMTLTKINAVSNEEERQIRYEFKTMNPHNVLKGEMIYLKYDTFYDGTNKLYESIYYICYVSDIINDNIFECIIYDENNKRVNSLNVFNIHNYRLFKKDSITPDYATFSKDGSCNFIWRDIINNGFDNENDNEIYPFFNGAFHVNKQINLFVRRQDPNEYANLLEETDIKPMLNKIIDEDNYYKDSEISC